MWSLPWLVKKDAPSIDPASLAVLLSSILLHLSASSFSFSARSFLAGVSLTLTVLYLLYLLGWRTKEEAKDTKQGHGENKSFLVASSTRWVLPPLSFPRSGPNFLSHIVQELWNHIAAALTASIQESIEPMFPQMLPTPLSTLRFIKFSLGDNPIRLENFVVHKSNNSVVKIDIDVDWETDCDILLKADYMGSFGIKMFTFKGRLEVLLHPVDKIPVVSAVQISFVNQPDIYFSFSGLAQVAELKVVKKAVLQIIQASLASMLVLPYRYLYKVDPGVSYLDIHTPLSGIARVTLINGKGFAIERRLFGRSDIPDVYCNITMGNKVWRSSTVKDNVQPVWNQTVDFCLCDYSQCLEINAFDQDKGTLDSDDHLGIAFVPVGKILADPKRSVEVNLINPKDGKETGGVLKLSIDTFTFTDDLSSLRTFTPNQMSGLIEIIVLRALNLPIQKERASTYVKVTCGKHEFCTGTVVDCPGYDALNPIYECAFLVPIEVKEDESDIVLTLYDSQTIIGAHTVTIISLKTMPNRLLTGIQSIGDKGASLELCVFLRGVQALEDGQNLPSVRDLSSRSSMSESLTRIRTPSAMRSSDQQIGTVRLTVAKGYGFKALRRRFQKADIPDVFCEIQFGSSSIPWRTATVNNSVNPQWNESKEFSLYDEVEIVTVDVYDDNETKKRGKSDLIGTGHVAIGKLLAATRDVDVAVNKKGKGVVGFITLRAEIIV